MSVASGLIAPLRLGATRHAAMLTNASALATGTLVTAMLGFSYWWFAARFFSPQAVGLASAAISMMNLLGHVGEFGLGPLLIGQMPRTRADAAALISTALLAVVLACAVIALAYIGLSAPFASSLGSILAGPGANLLFVVGVAVTGFTLVLDQAFVGLLRSGLQMSRNIVFSLGKLGLLVAVAWSLGALANEADIFNTWVAGQAVSLLVLAGFLLARRHAVWHRPRAALLRPLVGDVLSHHALNIVLQVPGLALPFVVTVILSAQTNAAFYAAWSLVNVVLLVPASLTTVVYSTGAREPALLGSRLKLSLALSGVVGLCASIGFFLFSPFILGLFNPAYPVIAGASLKMLGFGTLGVMIKYHYVALQRLRKRMMRAALVLGVGSVLELTLAALGGHYAGLDGLTEGWIAAVVLQAVLMIPGIVKAVAATPPASSAPADKDLSDGLLPAAHSASGAP